MISVVDREPLAAGLIHAVAGDRPDGGRTLAAILHRETGFPYPHHRNAGFTGFCRPAPPERR